MGGFEGRPLVKPGNAPLPPTSIGGVDNVPPLQVGAMHDKVPTLAKKAIEGLVGVPPPSPHKRKRDEVVKGISQCKKTRAPFLGPLNPRKPSPTPPTVNTGVSVFVVLSSTACAAINGLSALAFSPISLFGATSVPPIPTLVTSVTTIVCSTTTYFEAPLVSSARLTPTQASVSLAPPPVVPPPITSVSSPTMPSSSSRHAVRLEHAYTERGENSFWSLGYKPAVGSFLSPYDKDMIRSVGVENSLDAAEIYIQRTLAVLEDSRNMHKESLNMIATLEDEFTKWRSTARTVWKTEHPTGVGAFVPFVEAVKANQSSRFDDAFAKLVGTRLAGDQVFKRSKSTLRDKDDLVARVEVLIKEKETLDTQVSESAKTIAELQAKLKESVKSIAKLQARLKKSELTSVALQVKLKRSELEVLGAKMENKDLADELFLFKKEVVEHHEKGFYKAVRQAKLFVETLDVSRFDPFKDVKDGELVDEEEVAGDEESDGKDDDKDGAVA